MQLNVFISVGVQATFIYDFTVEIAAISCCTYDYKGKIPVQHIRAQFVRIIWDVMTEMEAICSSSKQQSLKEEEINEDEEVDDQDEQGDADDDDSTAMNRSQCQLISKKKKQDGVEVDSPIRRLATALNSTSNTSSSSQKSGGANNASPTKRGRKGNFLGRRNVKPTPPVTKRMTRPKELTFSSSHRGADSGYYTQRTRSSKRQWTPPLHDVDEFDSRRQRFLSTADISEDILRLQSGIAGGPDWYTGNWI